MAGVLTLAISLIVILLAVIQSLSQSETKLGLIILGNTGVGKSFIANTLLGKDIFVHETAPRAVTTATEFKEINTGNETYAIFNIPGLIEADQERIEADQERIEADQERIEANKVEIHKAFRERPTSLILYVFGSQGGRIRDEDVVAFNALNKAYAFKLESLVLIINGVPKDRRKNYEGEVIVLLEKLIKLPCKTLCVLDMINKNNTDERQKLKSKLLQMIVARTPWFHHKKHEIELQRKILHQAQAEIKLLQEAFQENKGMYEEKINEQQKKYDSMFATIHNQNENMRRLIERQAEEALKLRSQILEQEAAYRKNLEKQGAKYHKKLDKTQQKHKIEIQEARQASKLILRMSHFLH